eukprot:6250480-Pyramimonas_sp.AAC.1
MGQCRAHCTEPFKGRRATVVRCTIGNASRAPSPMMAPDGGVAALALGAYGLGNSFGFRFGCMSALPLVPSMHSGCREACSRFRWGLVCPVGFRRSAWAPPSSADIAP